VKSINTDARSSKRFRFASSKQRSKQASADVYRSYKRRIGVTSAASREERVFHPHREESAKKRQRRVDTDNSNKNNINKIDDSLFGDTVAEKHDKLAQKEGSSITVDDKVDLLEDVTEATFTEELDIANDRNASEIFREFYRDVWPLSRSLPEIMHHSSKIVDLLLAYLLSHEMEPHVKSNSFEKMASADTRMHQNRERFLLNHATTDLLHLLAVLAKDLRHEIHPFLHNKIIPRIVVDLLNQPTTSNLVHDDDSLLKDAEGDTIMEVDKEVEKKDDKIEDENQVKKPQQFMPIDVSIIEASFRTLSYIFRYDADALIIELEPGSKNAEPCLERLRQYYGATLAHRRDVVRRLAAETFAPLIRKLKSENARRRHLRRVLRALVTTVSASSDNKTTRVVRLQANAVDGISQLFFEVARGVAGQMNSKGKTAMKVLLDVLCAQGNKKELMSRSGRALIHSVTSIFLEKLCHHVHRRYIGDVLGEIIRTMQRVLEIIKGGRTLPEKGYDHGPQEYMIQLLIQAVSFRDGTLMEHNRDEQKYNSRSELTKVVVQVMNVLVPVFPDLPASAQMPVLSLLTATWKAIPSDPNFARQIKRHIGNIVQCHMIQGETAAMQHPVCVLARDLVPYLPPTVGMGLVGTSILSAAADLIEKDRELCLTLVLSIVKSSSLASASETTESEGSLFCLERATQCRVSAETKKKLLSACLLDFKDKKDSPSEICNLGVAALCISFLTLVGVKDEEDEHDEKSLKRSFDSTSKWLLDVFMFCSKKMDQDCNEKQDHSIVASLALESLAKLSMDFHRRDIGASSVKKLLVKTKKIVEKMLLSNPTSHWTLRSTAISAQALQMVGDFFEDRDAIFDALIPNLRNPSHVRRLYSLQILETLPKMPYVTDHADLDLADDLDEEPSEFVAATGPTGGVVRSGLCDIVETLVSLESTPIQFHNERQLLNLISRVEILGRTAKLPVVYTEAAANHMLGILYIKFSPIWADAVRAFISLATRQESFVWAPLKAQLSKLMTKMPEKEEQVFMDAAPSSENSAGAIFQQHGQFQAWDNSNGTDFSLFGGQGTQRLPTDEATVLQHAWSVLEGAPELMAKNSREIVPIFLQFMHAQFYARSPHDPDARELRIENHIEDTIKFDRGYLQSHIVHQRLVSMLKVFAVITGPKQLFKHDLLLSIFKSLLSQDIQVARLAFSCIVRYKIPSVAAFSEALEGLLAKGGLKEALLKFNSALESTTIDRENRRSLLPIVTRIVFGRMSARSGGSRSSKDSPAARRAAVLSFMAILCENEDDLYPLIYLMIRNFVPNRSLLVPVEIQGTSQRSAILHSVLSVSLDTVTALPTQAHIGFLYLLEVLIRQLGHRLAPFVDQFTFIVLSLCKLAEAKEILDEDEDRIVDALDEEHDSKDVDDVERSKKGFGALRTLGFRRLSEIFAQFAQVKNFEEFGPTMWEAIRTSVNMLPSTVVHCAKAPASLLLLETISSHDRLVPLLCVHEDSVPCAIKCLAETSTHPVVDATLSFIDNLLTYDEHHASNNTFVIRDHVDLILRQFTIRLGGKRVAVPAKVIGGSGHGGFQKPLRTQTWRRELRILCSITDIVKHKKDGVESYNRNENAEKLCALLAPYLDPSNFIAEADQMNVLNILETLIPKVGTVAGSAHFERMSQLLGPMKGKAGIVSPGIRRGIAATLSKAPQEEQAAATKVSLILQRLCKTHTKRVDELDYDVVISAVVSLGDSDSDASWLALATKTSGVDTKLISPLLFTCFHYLFSDDGVVSRGAFKALKMLLRLAANNADFNTEDNCKEPNEWGELLEKRLVPALRTGLSTKQAAARRFYILLMAEVARACRESPRPNLYGDLASLIREDDPDLDFFLNMTHVQMHRRTRAFQRLRKVLNSPEDAPDNRPFTLQSLSNVLLPIAMHPIYESKRRDEETLAIEAIATVGAISRHLSWSKYSNILWTSLTQFHRHEEQERYLVGMMCALIDGFHFDVSAQKDEDSGAGTGEGTAVWRALEKRFIPKIEGLLTKEKKDRNGTKHKTLRASLILALVKLFKKLSKSVFEARLPRLLTIICDGLKNRESDARDLARNTLSKVVADIEMDYLPDILREVSIALKDGFRLHVRIATVHSILLAIAEKYTAPLGCTYEEVLALSFDRSVPALMDIIQEDLFGAAQERKDAEGVQGRFVKEAAGSKSHNAIELVSSLIVFRPTLAKDHGVLNSSVHAIVSPLIERLKIPNVETKTIRIVKEGLSRVVSGLTRNPTVSLGEVLPFVYATASPFIGNIEFTSALQDKADGNSSDEEEIKPLHVTGSSEKHLTDIKSADIKKGSVANWRPSTLKSSKNGKGAAEVRRREAKEYRKVIDGASAPKLTGSSRYMLSSAASASKINEPANIAAVVFSLRLLSSVLKKKKAAPTAELIALIDPFIPLLTACVCTCRETDVVLLALRCLGTFLYFDVSSKDACAPSLGTKTLELLSSSGVSSNENNELSQACFKMLIMLMNLDTSQNNGASIDSATILQGEEALLKNNATPLDAEQMKILISFLQESIVDTDNHNAALNLVKAMMSRRFVSPEFYDLMETILELSVKSHRASLRQQCAGIVINYLLNYPLGETRLEHHLKQIVVNIRYQFEEGRLSGISLVTMVIEKIPEVALEKYVQHFFLPLTLQLVNDDSQKCREGVATCLASLLRRVSTEVVQSLFDFAFRWSKGDADVQKASLQVFAIFVESREDFLKRGDNASQLIEQIKGIIVNQSFERASWETFYFSLVCLEKLTKPFPTILKAQHDIWATITKCLGHPHHFLKQVASRLISHHLESLDPLSFAKDDSETFLVLRPGSLYEIARNLCYQLNAEEHHQNEQVTTLCIKSLCWLLPAMKQNPSLCYSMDDTESIGSRSSPVGWVMTRLSNIAKPKGPLRRQAVFKAFAAIATLCPEAVFPDHLEDMLEPLHRVDLETVNDVERPSLLSGQNNRRRDSSLADGESIPAEAVLARDVLRLLEDKCAAPEVFLRAFAAVKTKAREKKEQRKMEISSEAVRDPQAAAKRRQNRTEQGKQRKKRRVDERRQKRGGVARRRHMD